MKRYPLLLLLIAVVELLPDANAGQVTSGSFTVSGSVAQPRLSGNFVGEGFAAGCCWGGASSLLSGNIRQVGDPFAQRTSTISSDSDVTGTILESGPNFVEFIGSPIEIVAGQTNYIGTFEFSGELCQSGIRDANQPLNNCGLVYMPRSTGHGFYEVQYRIVTEEISSGPRDLYYFVSATYTFVPEPVTLGLLGVGLAGVGFARRKKARITA